MGVFVDRAVEEGCGDPKHANWKVVRDGFYGSEPRRRQRYRCVNPKNRSDWHRFRPAVVRFEAVEPHCLDCESPLSLGDGPNVAHTYDFAAREIAAALVAVANGATYSQASLGARRSLYAITQGCEAGERPYEQRPQPGQRGNETSRHGTLVTTWVETYTDVVLGTGPLETPKVLLLDSTSFWRYFGRRKKPAFHLLCAYGYPTWPGRGQLLHVAAYQHATGLNWTGLLSAFPGVPEVVVTDGGQDVLNGIDLRWPKPGVGNRPERVRCRWHLADNLREALVEDIRPFLKNPRTHPLYQRAEKAFDNLDEWENYRRVAYNSLVQFDPKSPTIPVAMRWLNSNDLRIRSQLLRRADDRPGPEAIGPVETEIQWLRRNLARRAQTLRNRPRTNQLLRLLVAGRTGRVDERAWADSIRRFLDDRNGHAPIQRQLAGAGGL
jgi:hypothetical protein